MLSIAATGMVTGLGLIVAIGAQNAFVLRQGLRREHIGIVVALCIVADALLIFGGTAGIGALVTRFPAALEVLRWGGGAYLAWWGIRSLASALRPTALTAQEPRTKGTIVLTALALTFLNPHVYLDTVVLLGSLANQHGPDARWIYAGGAAVGSLLWFTALGYGARSLSGVLNRPRTWQILDLLIGLVMLVLAARLVLG